MTLPKDFTKAVREWHEENGNIPLTRANGKTELMVIYQNLVPGKSTKQSDISVGRNFFIPVPTSLPDCFVDCLGTSFC